MNAFWATWIVYADMERLVQVADEMRQHQERFLLVLDRERRRRRLALEHRDGSAGRRHQIVVIGSLVAAIVATTFDVDIVEMVVGVASQ
jgi:hypothetical protein